jgi:hypothetical protein
MKYIVILILICVAVIAFILIRKRKIADRIDTFVCTECGEKHCICHKEEKSDPENS